MILFIDHCPERCYKVCIEAANPWSLTMTATRPSFVTMTAFFAAATALVLVAASPLLNIAAQVVA